MRFAALAGLAVLASAAPKKKPTKTINEANIGNMVVLKLEREHNGEKSPFGTLKLGLFNDELPKTTENFEWACENHFAGSPFHRVIPGFMAQGGDFTKGDGTGGRSKWGETFNDEAHIYKHDTAVLSMANRGPNTNGSQFFITFQPTSWLDGGHVVYGCATEGKDVLTALEANGSPSGKTNGKITIASCTISRAPKDAKCMAATSPSGDL